MIAQDGIGLLSMAFGAAVYGNYIRTIFTDNVKPHCFSWIVWGVILSVVAAAQYSQDAGAGEWVMALSAGFCFLIGGLAIWRGEKNIVRSDWVAFLGTLAAVPIWWLTRDPLWSVILVTAMDGVAFYPTFRKSYHKPDEESAITFTLDAMKLIASLFALEHVNMTTIFYPAVTALLNSTFVVMLLLRRRAMRR